MFVVHQPEPKESFVRPVCRQGLFHSSREIGNGQDYYHVEEGKASGPHPR